MIFDHDEKLIDSLIQEWRQRDRPGLDNHSLQFVRECMRTYALKMLCKYAPPFEPAPLYAPLRTDAELPVTPEEDEAFQALSARFLTQGQEER